MNAPIPANPQILPVQQGLTSAEVAERVAQGEVNAFEIHVGRTYGQIVRDNIFNVFNVVLAILGVIMIVFRDYANLAFASFSVILNSIVGLVQEISAKRALDRLAALSIQKVRVWRDGALTEVAVNEVVRDDVIPLVPGDRIVVDGVVLNADSLEVNEALLTGESDAILKEADQKLYSGAFVIAGTGLMRATEVGANSTINKLSTTAKQYRHPLTPTQKQINTLIEISVIVMLLFGPMTVIAGFVNRLPAIEVVRNAVVLVTSMVPQGLVLVTTISLSIGALIISRNRTLVQRINAVESMANVQVLCFDKTGTLTKNLLKVKEIIPLGSATMDEVQDQLREYVAALANQNRTAGAIAEYVNGADIAPAYPPKEREIPFTSSRKWGAIVFPNQTLILGAPERVLHPQRDADILAETERRSKQGERVLAFAYSMTAPQDGVLSDARRALALISMTDELRPEIRDTIASFYDQNVELKVISGDNAETVRAIAEQSGMKVRAVYSGDQLEAMGSAELTAAAVNGNVFARIEPETKRKLVRALKQSGYYVAMVGDGVNDVPALKEANMAVAMNDGAQITKDVADLVLLDNSMATLPLAFEKGKTITQKIFSTTRIFLIKNMFTVLSFIFIGFMSLPFPTTPILISWFTFCMVNVPGGLITFGFLRPIYLAKFSRDVMRYVLSAMFIGGLGMSLLYAALYLLRLGNAAGPELENVARDTARSAILFFMMLFSLNCFWQTMGIDFLRPNTFQTQPRLVFLGVVVAAMTVFAPYVVPNIFQGWVNPPFVAVLLSVAAAGICVVVLEWFYRSDVSERFSLPVPR